MYSYQHVVRTQGELNKQSNIYTNNVGWNNSIESDKRLLIGSTSEGARGN